jgi:protein TonB
VYGVGLVILGLGLRAKGREAASVAPPKAPVVGAALGAPNPPTAAAPPPNGLPLPPKPPALAAGVPTAVGEGVAPKPPPNPPVAAGVDAPPNPPPPKFRV